VGKHAEVFTDEAHRPALPNGYARSLDYAVEGVDARPEEIERLFLDKPTSTELMCDAVRIHTPDPEPTFRLLKSRPSNVERKRPARLNYHYAGGGINKKWKRKKQTSFVKIRVTRFLNNAGFTI